MSSNPPFVAEFNKKIQECENLVSIARASELQRDALEVLLALKSDIEKEKVIAIEKAQEDKANMLLGYECVVELLSAELKMWLFLKEERPDEAWDQLVTAQVATTGAVRAHDGFAHLEQHARRLEAIERLVFPRQVFSSTGWIVGFQECSICGGEYGSCSHLIGRPYMGEFCHIIARNIEIDHVAIVENPADKRCRVRQFSVDGGYRNRMTWRVENEAQGMPEPQPSEDDK